MSQLASTEYHVYRPWTEVVDYYHEEMRKKGWKLEREYTENVGDSSVRHFVDTCMVYTRFPGFVASIDLSGVVENGTPTATSVIVYTIMKDYISCQ